jgi:hypothetical protein
MLIKQIMQQDYHVRNCLKLIKMTQKFSHSSQKSQENFSFINLQKMP